MLQTFRITCHKIWWYDACCQSFVLENNLQFSRFKKCELQVFHVGDIVEVQLSFIGIPLKEKCRKMLVMLRSMALLDGWFSMVHQ